MPEDETDLQRGSGSQAWVLAVVLGFLGSALIAASPQWFEVVVRGGGMEQILATALPPMVFFLFFAVVGILNPLLIRFFRGSHLQALHLVAMLTMWLTTAAVVFSGGLGFVLNVIGGLRHAGLASTSVQRTGVLDEIPAAWSLSPEEAGQYFFGISFDGSAAALSEIPWEAWLGPLAFWFPVFAFSLVLAFSLVGICHHQWSRNENLCYPLADFAGSMIRRDESRYFPELFHNKIFWVGFFTISFVMLVNGLHSWFPVSVQIPMRFAHTDLIGHFPFLSNYCGGEAYSLFRGFFFPFVIALAVLLPQEISFTCSVGWVVMVLATGVYFLVMAQPLGATDAGVVQYGMYWGVLAMVVYIGRNHYGRVIQAAFFFARTSEPAMRAAVLSCRVFLICFAALVGIFHWGGMPLSLAFLVTATFALVVLVAARLTAETGVPWLVNLSGVSGLLPMHFLGSAAAGKQGISVLAVLSCVLGKNMGNSLAAQSTTIQQLDATSAKPRPGRTAVLVLAAVGVALAVGAFFAIWTNYSYGAQREARFTGILQNDLDLAASRIERLQTAAVGVDPVGIQPVAGFWGHFVGGAVIVFGCALLRLRFAWWPFHPLPFVFFNTWAMSRLYTSFLVGWLIKVAILKIAGGNFYLRSKPFFFGIIAGQLAWVFLWNLVGLGYYLMTGLNPPSNQLLF